LGGRPEYPNGASRTLNPKVDGLRVVAIIVLRESFAQLLRSYCSGCKCHLNACKCFCGCGVAVTRDPTQKAFIISRALVRHSCTSYSKHLRQGTLSRVLKDHLCKARGAFRDQLQRLLHALGEPVCTQTPQQRRHIGCFSRRTGCLRLLPQWAKVCFLARHKDWSCALVQAALGGDSSKS